MSRTKKIATAIFSVCAFAFALTGASLSGDAETSLADITAPETGFNKIVHYEFNDETNLGKDSVGNYDLVAQNVSLDPVNGGVALKNGGFLYAPKLDSEGTDFSDLVKGSYSVSMRAYLRNNNGGGNILATTGGYESSFSVDWNRNGLMVAQKADNAYKVDARNPAMLDTAFSWYRITVIYNESTLALSLNVTKESDENYSYEKTTVLPESITFGGDSKYTFTIGAQSMFGASVNSQANTAISDGTTDYTVYPNISDFRLYSGVIDSTEIVAITKYDTDNLATESSGYKGVVHYEFKYAANIGKDTLGNYDLVATDGVTVDEANGGITLGGTNGVLYAPALYPVKIGASTDGYVDFSDLIKGSYSVSMRAFLRSVDDGANYLIATGSYGSAFQAAWSYQGLAMDLGNAQGGKFGTSTNDLGGKAMFDATFSWYRITMIYDESAKTFRVITTKESDNTYSFDYTKELTSAVTFGGCSKGYGFTIGGQSKMGNDVAQHVSTILKADKTTVYPNISDFRLYSGVIDETELAAISKYDKDNLAENDLSNAVEKEVKPLVWYEFNEENNPGKDSMGNFDLLVGGQGLIAHNADGYVTFTRENASFLYAPAIVGRSDWSDLLKGGYTLSYTVKADNTVSEGNRYAITTSDYGNGFLVLGLRDGYDVVYSAGGYNSHMARYETGSHKDTWVNITVSMNKVTSKLAFYINGELFDERTVSDYQGFTGNNAYSFVIGGQATCGGTSGAQYFEGSIADVKVYDFALSSKNVKDMYANADSDMPFTSLATYQTVESVEVDTAGVNVVLDKNNSVQNVFSNLPAEVTVKNRADEEEKCSVVWLAYENGVITGYVQGTSSSNVGSIFAEVKLSYIVDFSSLTNGAFEDVQIDGQSYNGEAISVGGNKALTFKVAANTGYKVASVSFNDQKILPDENGVYTVSVSDFSRVSAYISAEEYVITYVLNNGQENEEQIFGYGESVELAYYYTKEGYVFDGWYDNAELSGERITGIDSLNPENVTLYAKWAEKTDEPGNPIDSENTNNPSDNTSNGNSDSSGCKSSVGGISAVLPLCTLFGVAVLKRKQD